MASANRRIEAPSRFLFYKLGVTDHLNDVRTGHRGLAGRELPIDFHQQARFPGMPVAVHFLEARMQRGKCPPGFLLINAPGGHLEQGSKDIKLRMLLSRLLST